MTETDKPQGYHVAWYVNGQTVQRDVTVWIAEGRLQGTEAGCATDAIELGRVALIPGLVNSHTHLEFSLLPQPIPTAGPFTDWIRSVVSYRREHPTETGRAIRQGVAEAIRSGTTLIGDIATTGWVGADYQAAGFQGVVFQELLGLGDERVAQQCDLARAIVDEPPPAGQIQYGLSPHAPYSVHPRLLDAAVDIAGKACRPVAMHLAETPAEMELLTHGTGEFYEMLTSFGIWRDGLFGGKRVADYPRRLAECPRALVVHGNYLEQQDLEFLAANPQMTLVYCPRTHAAFGHRDHPWRRLLALGGAVAIGTDSRASNPDLSLFAELQFLAAQHPDMSHLDLLTLGSQAGRRALLGETAPRGQADFCVVAGDEFTDLDPARSLFAAGNRVIGTMIKGDWRYADGRLPVRAGETSDPISEK